MDLAGDLGAGDQKRQAVERGADRAIKIAVIVAPLNSSHHMSAVRR
jgi:hypothetical protein